MTEGQIVASNETATLAHYRHRTDAECKRLLADKLILACILKTCTTEFQDYDVHDIETKYIEGEPEVGAVGVHPDTTNAKGSGGQVRGICNESTSDTEGRVMFDIRFTAWIPAKGTKKKAKDKKGAIEKETDKAEADKAEADKERIELIINVEAQNDYYPGYPLVKRGFYYACRQVSAQYGPEFTGSHYENIKKVYSIWVCFDPPKNRHNTITRYRIAEESIVGTATESVENYDLISVVMICLGTKEDERYTGLLKLLDVFMSKEADLKAKEETLQSEFGAQLPKRMRKKEDGMCNYSDYVWNKSERKARALDLFNLMKNLQWTIEQALHALSIPEDKWEDYREMVDRMGAQPSA